MKVLWLIPLLALMSCGELPAVIADETKPAENQTLPVQTEQRVPNLPQKTETLSLSNFIGDYSVFGECPKHDWNTGILSLSEDYISLTETGCKIASAAPIDSETLLLNLTDCHAEGESMADEKAKLTKVGNRKTLQYLPNDDGKLNRSGKVFELTPCTGEARD